MAAKKKPITPKEQKILARLQTKLQQLDSLHDRSSRKAREVRNVHREFLKARGWIEECRYIRHNGSSYTPSREEYIYRRPNGTSWYSLRAALEKESPAVGGRYKLGIW